MLKKEYKKGDLTIVWQPDLCIHSGVCFHNLPAVFKPRDRPWVRPEAADDTALIEAVNACPSGALSIKAAPIPTVSADTQVQEKSKVKLFENGPIRVLGPVEITMPDGTIVEKPNGISFCRCGGSASWPFCDSSHKTNGFKG
ncbi:MAG: (4Fe-4S)-binding protein [Saprospiraceae bacterium]|nr:(4Fe-4S)-binding protein [Candidatus Opimibacter iunctus]